ncbi:hemolysin family protein [Solicola gregarius]|uniref:Hemolysin family protein n=1 Tax=Solicola gregarius TaxID=2908642 RepID=A0AA46TJX5_9ACTN|nr:hemolysin family protein [Solicola gregarius]UYM06640.1 hemolysin family protein [Solicola gregarius]
MTEWLLLGLSLFLMLSCGVFVAAEFAFVTVDRASVERAADRGDRGAAGTASALRSLSTQLSGAQLGITLTNLLIGYLSEPAIASLLRPPLHSLGVSDGSVPGLAVALGIAISTVVTMLVGELIPKNVAIALPQATAFATQRPMRAFTAAMAWPIGWLNGAANRILRAMKVEPQEELGSARMPEELYALVRRSAEEGTLEAKTADLVARSITFGDRTAADVRTPRMQVRFLDGKQTALDLVEAVRETGHSRFPVTGKTTDDILGVVHIKQAVAIEPERRRSTRLETFVSPAAVVPDTLELDPLLALLRHQGMQLAVVVDEYGGTDGVVTLEDLVEELVGEIADEHDRAQLSKLRTNPDGSWRLSGMLRPDEIATESGIALPTSEDYETVAGLVLKQLGRLAAAGDEVTVRASEPPDSDDEELGRRPVDVRLRVERVVGRRIDRITMRRLPTNPEVLS